MIAEEMQENFNLGYRAAIANFERDEILSNSLSQAIEVEKQVLAVMQANLEKLKKINKAKASE